MLTAVVVDDQHSPNIRLLDLKQIANVINQGPEQTFYFISLKFIWGLTIVNGFLYFRNHFFVIIARIIMFFVLLACPFLE